MTGAQLRFGHSALITYPCLPELTLVLNVMWHWSASELTHFSFRCQNLNYSTYYNPQFCLDLRLSPTAATFSRKWNWLDNLIENYIYPLPLALDAWHKFRFSIWSLPNNTAPTHTGYRLERWDTDHWLVLMDALWPQTWYYNSAVNYLSFFMHYGGHFNDWGARVDDMEVWVPP